MNSAPFRLLAWRAGGRTVLGLFVFCCCIAPAPAQRWIDDGFEDFIQGSLDASGHNLYVSRDGKVQSINRFDLNQDGFLDLVFNNNHDWYYWTPATLGTVGADRQIRESELAVHGSASVIAHDLNLNGHADLIFSPSPGGTQHPRRFVTIIWGGADGWPAHRANGVLPVENARSIAVVNLNGDKWPDIAVLGGSEDDALLTVFFGSSEGFLLRRRWELPVAGAVSILGGDFDQNGRRDLAVLTREGRVDFVWAGEEALSVGVRLQLDGNAAGSLAVADLNRSGQPDLAVRTDSGVYMFPGSEGRGWGAPTRLTDKVASHFSILDLDRDGFPDLVLTVPQDVSAQTVEILWGSSGGFQSAPVTGFSVPWAAATALGDLDGDGCPDLAVAVSQGTDTHRAESPLLFGDCKRGFSGETAAIRTDGATDVTILPARDESPGQVIVANRRGGTINEDVPILVYLGGADGFDAERRWEIPFRSGYQASAADLDADGYVDLVAVNAGSTRENPYLGVTVFWGGPDGPSESTRRTNLPEKSVATSSIADLNRDGYLDLVLGTYFGDGPDALIIYYGSNRGFTAERREVLSVDVSDEKSPTLGWVGPPTIADFNRDGWLDIAATCSHTDTVWIFWGGPEGFRERSRLLAPGPYSSKAADLNGDGYLDLVVGTFNEYRGDYHDTGTLIFWGGPGGFESWNSQWLPGLWVAGVVVADFDGDGFLDLFTSHYHGALSRESLPSFIYWGSAEGFDIRKRAPLVADSVHDALAGDFNGNGLLDLAVSCHSSDSTHRISSKVFFNDGSRFANPQVLELPTVGTHWMWGQDIGHVYNRGWEQFYESKIFEWNQPRKEGTLHYLAELAPGTVLTFSVRSAGSREELRRQHWKEVAASSFSVAASDRLLQYRAVFGSDNGDRYPILDQVIVELNP